MKYPKAPPYTLSKEAKQVAQLLDREAFAAAKRLMQAHISPSSTDAGLFAMEARFHIMTVARNEPWLVESALVPGRSAHALPVCMQAAKLAAEFDAGIKPYMADLMCRGVCERGAELLRSSHEFVRSEVPLTEQEVLSQMGFPDSEAVEPFVVNLVTVAMFARYIDQQTGLAWSHPYFELADRFGEKGMVRSALLLASAGAVLSQVEPVSEMVNRVREGKAAGELGAEAFRSLTSAFERSVQRYNPDAQVDHLQPSLDFFEKAYKAEIATALAKDPNCPELRSLAESLRKHGKQPKF